MTNETSFSASASETSFAKETDSIEIMVRYLGTIFDCRDGPYRSYVEHEGERLPYVVLGFITPESTGDAPQRLRNGLLYSLITIREDLLKRGIAPILYWRYHSSQRIQEDYEKPDHWNVPAEIRRPGRHKIYTRLAIPGANWSLVETKKEGEPFVELK